MKRGIVSLSVLIILAAWLTLALLFAEDNLAYLRQQSALRSDYMDSFWELQHKSADTKSDPCLGIGSENELTQRIEIVGNARYSDAPLHYIWCERKALFKKPITKKGHIGELKQFVTVTQLLAEPAAFVNAPLYLEPTATPQIYWFPRNKGYTRLNGEVYGIILAEQDFELSGKGTFRGSIITGGALQVNAQAAYAYHAKTVKALSYGAWHRLAQSWIDYDVKD